MKEYYVVLADDYGSSMYSTDYSPIGIIEEFNAKGIREVIAKFILAELNLDDDEGEEMLSDVVTKLIKNGCYNEVDAEIAFKIEKAPFFDYL